MKGKVYKAETNTSTYALTVSTKVWDQAEILQDHASTFEEKIVLKEAANKKALNNDV